MSHAIEAGVEAVVVAGGNSPSDLGNLPTGMVDHLDLGVDSVVEDQ